MANKKPSGAEEVVAALCKDYPRRLEAIRNESESRRVLMEYRYYNGRILEGVGEIVGAALSEIFIYDIGNRRGYTSSEVPVMSESTYKRYKAAAVMNIARKLHYVT